MNYANHVCTTHSAISLHDNIYFLHLDDKTVAVADTQLNLTTFLLSLLRLIRMLHQQVA
jgi:hypothetical protein